MECAHPSCLCRSEVGIQKDGRTYCSDHCATLWRRTAENQGCHCGHAGCSSRESGTALS